MRITGRQLRRLIREELLRERYLPRISSTADAQRALNSALAGQEGFVLLDDDSQWGPKTEDAWELFVDKFYNPDTYTKPDGQTPDPKITAQEIKDEWKSVAGALGFTGDPDGATNFIRHLSPAAAADVKGDPQGAVAGVAGPVATIEGPPLTANLAPRALPDAANAPTDKSTFPRINERPWRFGDERDVIPVEITVSDGKEWLVSYDGKPWEGTGDRWASAEEITRDHTPRMKKAIQAGKYVEIVGREDFTSFPAGAFGYTLHDQYELLNFLEEPPPARARLFDPFEAPTGVGTQTTVLPPSPAAGTPILAATTADQPLPSNITVDMAPGWDFDFYSPDDPRRDSEGFVTLTYKKEDLIDGDAFQQMESYLKTADPPILYVIASTASGKPFLIQDVSQLRSFFGANLKESAVRRWCRLAGLLKD